MFGLSFHLMLQPMLGCCPVTGSSPVSSASSALRRSAPVTGLPLLGLESSSCPR